MKSPIILAFLVAISASSFAQTAEQKVEKPWWQLGLSFSPDICYRLLYNGNNSSSTANTISSRNDTEIPMLGYTTGLGVCYNVNKRASLEVGFRFANQGKRTRIVDLIFTPADTVNPDRARLKYKYHYLEIPLKTNVYFGKGNLRVLTGLAVTTSLFQQQKTTLVVFSTDSKTKQSEISSTNYTKINFKLDLCAGIDYRLNAKSNIRVEPTFRYYLKPSVEAPVLENLYSFGWNLGYYRNL